jgi:hypothetical protein
MCGMHMCIYICIYIYNYIYIVTYIYIGFKPSVSRGKLAQRSLWNRQRKLTSNKPFLTWILRKGSGTYYKKKYKILMLHILHVPIWSYLIYWNSETVWMVRGRKNGPVLGPPNSRESRPLTWQMFKRSSEKYLGKLQLCQLSEMIEMSKWNATWGKSIQIHPRPP